MNEQNQTQTSKFQNYLLKISRWMAAIGAVTFGAMMFLTVIDVTGRYFFLRPFEGAVEIVAILFVIGGSWGMGYAQLRQTHIRITFFSNKAPKKFQLGLSILTPFISAVASGLVAWQSFLKTFDYITATRGQLTDVLGMPYWPFTLMMAIGFAWACIIFLISFFRSMPGVFKQ